MTRELEAAIGTAAGLLSGTLFLPSTDAMTQRGARHPSIVIVHGSGAVDRFGADGTLHPIISHFTASGYAVLSYDKPGVGDSAGDWLRQTFEDRAAETVAATRFLAAHPAVDSTRIGLWGISQGGWVGPLAAVLAPDEISFLIVVSASAMSPCAQFEHQLRTEMTRDGFDDGQIAAALALSARRTAALSAGVPGAEILAAESEALRAEPWYRYCRAEADELEFVRPIWQFDLSPSLRSLRCPLLAIWGADDIHMPAQVCAAGFAADLATAGHPDFRLQVYPRAGHRMRVDAPGLPPDTFAAGYLEEMADWLDRRIGRCPRKSNTEILPATRVSSRIFDSGAHCAPEHARFSRAGEEMREVLTERDDRSFGRVRIRTATECASEESELFIENLRSRRRYLARRLARGHRPVLAALGVGRGLLFGQVGVLAVEAPRAAWVHGDDWLDDVRALLDRNRRLLSEHLRSAIGYRIPKATLPRVARLPGPEIGR